MTMGFCPVCGGLGEAIHPRCDRLGRYYGYGTAELSRFLAEKTSIAVPFFDVNRFLYALDHLARHPMVTAMVEAVEQRGLSVEPREFGNLVRVLPYSDSRFGDWQGLYIKEDVSKTAVVYQYEDAIEHLGSEERATAFAEIADRFFGLGEHVPPTAMGLSSAGTKYVVSAGFPRPRFTPLEDKTSDLSPIWQAGTLARLALLDFVLGQNDRNAQNVLLSDDAPVRIGLIDNDDSFVAHERLFGRFAYLGGLDSNLSLHVVRDWFQFHLPDLLALLAPLALPETTTLPLCRRFVFARRAVELGLSIADFTRAIFVDRIVFDWQLPDVAWAAYQLLVKEERQGTLYRALVGERVDDTFRVSVLAGKLLHPAVTVTESARESSVADATAAMSSLAADLRGDGYVHLIRRRLFVANNAPCSEDDLRIVEVRDDLSGYHVVIRQGNLGHYDSRRIAKFISFATSSEAVAHADAVEDDLHASGFVDLRARLASFKDPSSTGCWGATF